MVELKDRRQQETEGQLQFHSHLMLMERMSASESSQLKGLYVGDLLYFLAHDRSPPIATENPQC